ncbi:MAG: epimerase [Acidimicrobiia bacterium]|nr:MAG: epimerase [Acidimicrobiia bacterium]
MRVLITGSTGLLGTALAARLEERGDEAVGLRRGPDRNRIGWDPASGWIHPAALEGYDAVVHLAGKPISPPFTARRMEAIRASRVEGTRLIAAEVVRHRPRVFVSASAIGYYGNRGDEILTEQAPPGTGFLADVCRAWEEATSPARDAGVRTVMIRTGLVLANEGGLFPRITLPFKLGLGGPVGPGTQWWSWITLVDHVAATLRCIDDPDLEGPVNLTAPEPTRNRDFARELGRRLRRPARVRVPAWALRLALGRAADELVLASQRVLPARLQQAGFRFSHPDLESALSWLIGDR